jgi:hypothetical protein
MTRCKTKSADVAASINIQTGVNTATCVDMSVRTNILVGVQTTSADSLRVLVVGKTRITRSYSIIVKLNICITACG